MTACMMHASYIYIWLWVKCTNQRDVNCIIIYTCVWFDQLLKGKCCIRPVDIVFERPLFKNATIGIWKKTELHAYSFSNTYTSNRDFSSFIQVNIHLRVFKYFELEPLLVRISNTMKCWYLFLNIGNINCVYIKRGGGVQCCFDIYKGVHQDLETV